MLTNRKVTKILKENTTSIIDYVNAMTDKFNSMLGKNTPATLLCDFYKLAHRQQYPDNTEVVYSTWTPRSNKHMPTAKKAIVLGQQMVIKKYLIDYFQENFFNKPLSIVLKEYRRYVTDCLGEEKPYTRHIIELHTLGYMPLEINALPEGTRCPFRVPMLTIHNTDERFAWLTNYLETLLSAEMWGPSTTATIADLYMEIMLKYAKETGGDINFVPFQGHDFSMRGSMGIEASKLTGIGHLATFVGTDTIPAIFAIEEYYNGDISTDLIGTSVPATEHSVMCAGGKLEELETYRRLMVDVHPSGILSIVSDTWDLWSTVTTILPALKKEIMARDGKIVIRPDSGDPVDIICGLSENSYGVGGTIRNRTRFEPVPSDEEWKGLIELLWDTFGGTINDEGYKVLDPHIGAIYGDSITLERCEDILSRLKDKGFASTNIVFGIGSFTYSYITRDSLGFAMKSVMAKVDGSELHIFKDPATDDGTKKSNKGCVAVQEVNGELVCKDGLPLDNDEENLMRTIFSNGTLLVDDKWSDIKERIASTRN